MKKNLLVAAAVLLAAGCAKVTTVDTAEPQEIKLEGYTYAVTKAPIANDATLSDTGYDMLVHAIHVNGESNVYFTNSGVTFKEQSGSTNKWAGTTPQYWPSEGTLTFNAISPVTISPGKTILTSTSFTYADGAVSAIGAILNDNSTNQADVLVAKTVTGQNKTNNATGVEMTFYHALAQIVVTAKAGSNAPTTQINSIKLNNTAQSGNLSASNLSNADGPSFAWTAPVYTDVDFDATFFDTNLTTTESAESTGILVIPVDEKDGAKYSITVNYDLGSNTGLESTLELLSSDAGKISEWEAGKKYVYNLTITATEILIAPSVDNWDDSSTEDDVTVGE